MNLKDHKEYSSPPMFYSRIKVVWYFDNISWRSEEGRGVATWSCDTLFNFIWLRHHSDLVEKNGNEVLERVSCHDNCIEFIGFRLPRIYPQTRHDETKKCSKITSKIESWLPPANAAANSSQYHVFNLIRSWKSPYRMDFVDMEKVFDNVNWNKLFVILRNTGLNYKDRGIIANNARSNR